MVCAEYPQRGPISLEANFRRSSRDDSSVTVMPPKEVDLNSPEIQRDLDDLRVLGGAHVLSVALCQFPEEPQILELYCPAHASQDGFDPRCSGSLTSSPQRCKNSSVAQPWEKGSVVYQTGSITKCAISVTIYRLIVEAKSKEFQYSRDLAIAFDKIALPFFYLWYRFRYPNRDIEELSLNTNPNIASLLSHRNGFADINDFLFGPDGTFIMTEEEFLEVAVNLTNSQPERDRRGKIEYSNANYIFLGRLIELITDKSLPCALQHYVFGPMGMLDTSMDKTYLSTLRTTLPFAVGHLIASNGVQKSTNFEHLLDSPLQAAAMGLRSSVRDLTTFAQHILAAKAGRSGLFSWEGVKVLFVGQPYTRFGCYTNLNQRSIQSESYVLNLCPNLPILGSGDRTAATSVAYNAEHKAGYVDGFGGAMVILPSQQRSIVVLTDSLSTSDTADLAIRYLLQRVLPFNHSTDIMAAAKEAKDDVSRNLGNLEAKSGASSSILPMDIPGTYQHTHCQQKILITNEGTARVYYDEDIQSQSMRVLYLGNNTIRLVTQVPLCLERWAKWQNVDFVFSAAYGDRHLMRENHRFQRVTDQDP